MSKLKSIVNSTYKLVLFFAALLSIGVVLFITVPKNCSGDRPFTPSITDSTDTETPIQPTEIDEDSMESSTPPLGPVHISHAVDTTSDLGSIGSSSISDPPVKMNILVPGMAKNEDAVTEVCVLIINNQSLDLDRKVTSLLQNLIVDSTELVTKTIELESSFIDGGGFAKLISHNSVTRLLNELQAHVDYIIIGECSHDYFPDSIQIGATNCILNLDAAIYHTTKQTSTRLVSGHSNGTEFSNNKSLNRAFIKLIGELPEKLKSYQ